SDTGVIATFCIVNIPGLSELAPEIPYVSAQILLDGANNTFFGLIRGCEVDDVHMGMRVKARWADELRPDHTSIKWFEPTGEPDAPYDHYKDYL
ncbi:MAG TPA: OB-fold domain-containing protein, partial [Acidimicrobiia bacterium]|nr:OB-fold domain-containing protein [Acidimicrobiia bacterium]